MNSYSITRRLIVVVLMLESLAAASLVALATFHESRIRFRTLDATLQSRAATLFGAVGEADDANVRLDMREITFPEHDLYSVADEDGRILGQSRSWPAASIQSSSVDGIFGSKVDGHAYRFVRLQGIRIIDPGERKGGIVHHITLYYGSPTNLVWREVGEAVQFYAFASLFLLTLTGITMAWFLRRGLAPLRELAQEASRISAKRWQFTTPNSARAITELAPLSHAIEAALLRLQETFQQQRRFTSASAHELKTDVSIVKSSLQLLAMRHRSEEEYRHGLEVTLKDCDRMENTVQEMLMLARMEQTVAQQSENTADLAIVIQDVIQRFASLADLKDITITIVSQGMALVSSAPEDCDILCSNLLHNAIQHSHVTSGIGVKLWNEARNVVLSIEDRGEGIAPDVLPHVFEPFYRGDASRDRKTGGTGLGLSICKAICERAGGSIEVHSAYGCGTSVLVRLPKKGSPSS